MRRLLVIAMAVFLVGAMGGAASGGGDGNLIVSVNVEPPGDVPDFWADASGSATLNFFYPDNPVWEPLGYVGIMAHALPKPRHGRA